ncbi:hypothetical protein S245_027353, partial [Arachis hypogaea]
DPFPLSSKQTFKTIHRAPEYQEHQINFLSAFIRRRASVHHVRATGDRRRPFQNATMLPSPPCASWCINQSFPNLSRDDVVPAMCEGQGVSPTHGGRAAAAACPCSQRCWIPPALLRRTLND